MNVPINHKWLKSGIKASILGLCFLIVGGSWGKEQEVNIIKSGGIHYKKADIHKVSVNIIGTTAILLNKITLLAEMKLLIRSRLRKSIFSKTDHGN